MPPLEYDAPLVCVASPACGILKHMLTSFLMKLGSETPLHIPREHHTPSSTASTTTEDFHSLHRSKVSKFDGIRLYARLFKTLEKQRFPPYSILSYSRAFYLQRERKIKKTSSGSFFQKKCFWLYATVFLVYYAFCGVRRSVSICGVRWGPLGCDDTPRVRCHMSMRGGKSPERRIQGHNSPNSTTERMLAVVV